MAGAPHSSLITRRLIRPWLPARPREAHKGLFGHVLVVAGSRGMTGAAMLCAAAALRSGAGLVTLAVPKSQQPVVAAHGRREMMTLALPETREGALHRRALKRVLQFAKSHGVTSLAVGPGLRVTRETIQFLKGLLRRVAVPVVLDADGLNALAQGGWPRRTAGALALTPHPGELARLLRTSVRAIQKNRAAAAAGISRQREAICLLKGRGTLIADGRRIFRNTTGNAGLAKGGSGDVLAGVVAALTGQMRGANAVKRVWRACLIGAYLHGLAADLAVRRTTRIALMAGDVIDFLPEAFRKIFGEKI